MPYCARLYRKISFNMWALANYLAGLVDHLRLGQVLASEHLGLEVHTDENDRHEGQCCQTQAPVIVQRQAHPDAQCGDGLHDQPQTTPCCLVWREEEGYKCRWCGETWWKCLNGDALWAALWLVSICIKSLYCSTQRRIPQCNSCSMSQSISHVSKISPHIHIKL